MAEDSPRSAKRRKLDAPESSTSNKSTKSTPKTHGNHDSPALAKLKKILHKGAPNGSPLVPGKENNGPTAEQEEEEDPVNGRAQSTRKGGAAIAEEEEDNNAQDTTEIGVPESGARTSRRERRLPARYREDGVSSPARSTPRSTPARTTPAKRTYTRKSTTKDAATEPLREEDQKSARQSEFKAAISGFNFEPEVENGVAGDDSPSKRQEKRRAASGTIKLTRTTLGSGRSVRRKQPVPEPARSPTPEQLLEIPESPDAYLNGHGESLQTQGAGQIPEPEEEEEEEAETPRPSPRTRRRANRTDHIDNDADVDKLKSPRPTLQAESPIHIEPKLALNGITHTLSKPPLQPLGEGPTAQLSLLKTILLSKLTSKRPFPLIALEEEHRKVHQLVEHTIAAGEGNSLLLIGSRGSGKTALVNSVLRDMAARYPDEHYVVRLNGFIQTDDKLALREIWRQLGREMALDEEEEAKGQGKGYADTLATLLALLSHPSELQGGQGQGQELEQVAKSVIFVLDEFDLFAAHPRQTLLYNLFDIAQSRKAPIAVLGLTTRLDVAESLEKRVKSRFSHRYVHLSLARSLVVFTEMVRAAMCVRQEELSFEERALLQGGKTVNTKADNATTSSEPIPNLLSSWNTFVETLLTTPPLTTLIKYHYTLSKSLPTLLTAFLPSVPLITYPFHPSTTLLPTRSLLPPSSNLTLLPTLPTLSLALLIASARLDTIHDTESFTFSLAYSEYLSLVSRAKSVASASGSLAVVGEGGRVWGRSVAVGAWEELVELGFLIPVSGGLGGGGGGSGGGSGGWAGRLVRVDVGLEEIAGAVPGMGSVMQRWCREV